MKKFCNKIKRIELVKYLWLPIFLIVAWLIFLSALDINDGDSKQIVLGIVLGTSLGFIAEILKKSWDAYQKDIKIKVVARTLLSRDALSIYKTMYLYKGLLAQKNTPFDVKSFMPPALDLRYWKKISDDKEFLLLASEEPFTSWYEKMFNFEKLNSFRVEAEEQFKMKEFEGKFNPMAGIYTAAYQNSVEDNDHLNFALNFYTQDELDSEVRKK